MKKIKSVQVFLTGGQDVTWSREKDGLAAVQVHDSGTLLIMVKGGSYLSRASGVERDAMVVKHGYMMAAWVTFDVEWEDEA